MRDEPKSNGEKLCRAIFGQAAVGVAEIVSRTGELLSINGKYCDIVGYARKEMEQSTLQRITHPEDLEAAEEKMRLLLDGKIREFSLEKRYYRKDGSVVWVNLTVSPLWEIGEEPSCHIEVAQDITEMKNTEEALKKAYNQLEHRVDGRREEPASAAGQLEEEIGGRTEAEEALRNRERLLTRAIALTRIGTWVWDIERDECHVSGQWLNFQNMNNSVRTMKEMVSLVHPEDRSLVEEALQRALDGIKPYDVEHRVTRPDTGETCWLRSCGEVIEDESGNPVRIEGAFQDISDRKLAETEQVKSAERLRLAMAATVDGVWDWNVTTGDVHRSPSFFTMLGYTPEDAPVRNEAWLSLVEPDDLPRVKELIREYISGGRDRFEIEFRMLHKNSKTIWILSRGKVVERDSDGKPVRVTGTHTDITFFKEAEQELRASEERYRAVIDNAGVGIDVLDRDGRFLQANQALSNMLGYKEEELRQLTFVDITHREDREISKLKLGALTRGEIGPYRLEKRFIRKDGSVLWGDLSTAVIRDPHGEHEATIGIIADITERKKAEQALKESEARVRLKLDSIMSPDGDIGILELADVIDIDAIQAIMDDFHSITNIGVAILDIKGNVLVATGWQDICVKFHRIHPEARENCRESDTVLSSGVEEGSFKLYRCKNNMWDMVTPIIIGGKHLGNLFLGQFLFENESPDYSVFRSQARKYGFDEEQYLAALERVPRWSKETIETVMRFYTKMTHLLSVLSYSNIKLARTLAERDRLVTSVQEGEAKYRRLFANSPVGIISIDTSGKILEVNPKLVEILGSPSAEATKAINMFNFPPLRESGFADAFEKCIATGESFSVEAPYKSKWEKPTHLRVLLTPIIDEEDLVQGCQAVVEDVTDRKRAEQALRESEERLRLVTNTIQDVFWMRTPGIKKTLYVSSAYEKIWGRSRASLYKSPQSFLDAIHPDDRRRIQERVNDHAEGRWDHDYRIIAADGTVRWISDHGYPIYDEHGNLRMMTGVARDITKRKAAEEELQRNLSALKQSETIANQGYFERNWQTGDGYWSDGFYRLLGRQPGRILSHDDFMTYIHDDDRDRVAAHIMTTLQTRDPMNIEFRIVQESGHVLTIHGVADTTYDKEGKPLLTRGTFQDITTQKSLQEQLREAQKMEAVGTLAGGISHDFNNLLHIISGHAELLETELAERKLRFSETTAIRRAAQRGAELVKQILTFSRRVDTKFELTDLNEDVKNAERLLSRTIPKMIEIELLLEEGLRPVRADSTQIEQTVINLAVNAKDAMPEGGKLTIETRNVDLDEQDCRGHEQLVPGRYVLLKVSDTGQGMEERVLQHVFEPFFTTKELADGTGLGLATVFGIVKMHGGLITCESALGKGTAFSIYFPAVEASKLQIQQDQKSPAVTGGTETILVVDDEELIRNLAKKILEKAGYSVMTAGSGKEAVEIYKRDRSKISLVILDLIMPEMGGARCLDELLKIDPAVKALMASGFAVKGETATFLYSEAKGTLNKPFDIDELLRSVRNVLDETHHD